MIECSLFSGNLFGGRIIMKTPARTPDRTLERGIVNDSRADYVPDYVGEIPGLRLDIYMASYLKEKDRRDGKSITGGDRIYLHDEWFKLADPATIDKGYNVTKYPDGAKILDLSGDTVLPVGFFISDLSLSDREVLKEYERFFKEGFENSASCGVFRPEEFFSKMNDFLHAWRNLSERGLTAALSYAFAEPSGVVEYWNAGAPWPLHYSARERKVTHWQDVEKAKPLGIFSSEYNYSKDGRDRNFQTDLKPNVFYLEPGDAFIMASDGFGEGTKKRNYLKPETVEEIIKSEPFISAHDIGKAMLNHLNGIPDMQSDYSIVVIKRPEDAVADLKAALEIIQKGSKEYRG
ncbi:hypothetical protein D6764_02725 [Candidatus Woesearchaeota archaeon]|nr:MAG: hypothetical protein D6764_02725 [Candidatus Woesearchaeota archaeon]